jgi:16S rRNA (cytidine1402-2'-O)-methyltransferase
MDSEFSKGDSMKKGTLYLVPSLLGDTPVRNSIPDYNLTLLSRITYFIVEEVRSARRFLKKAIPSLTIDDLQFLIFNEHTAPEEVSSFIQPLLEGNDVGLLSEAGLPCVADPGTELIRLAHDSGIRVIPLVGPSSLMLALMASGFNGQNFCFSGYLPVDKNQRIKQLRELERNLYKDDQTQIFIEAPYRNIQIFQAVLEACRDTTRLCLATELTTTNESIQVKSVKEWKGKHPDIEKKPTVFLLYH